MRLATAMLICLNSHVAPLRPSDDADVLAFAVALVMCTFVHGFRSYGFDVLLSFLLLVVVVLLLLQYLMQMQLLWLLLSIIELCVKRL